MRGPVTEYKDKLVELYGEERASEITAVEAFQVSEYGWNPGMETLKKMFPFFPDYPISKQTSEAGIGICPKVYNQIP